jgi:hypothetical protein
VLTGPSGKGRISVVETLGGGEGKMKGGRREVEPGLTALAGDFELRGSGEEYLRIQSVPRRKHRTSPLKRSTG